MQFREIVNEISQQLDGKVGTISIKTYINRIIREICSLAIFDGYIAESTISMVSGTESYTLATDFSKEVAVMHTNVLDYEPWSLYAQKNRTSVGVPKTYTVKGTSILFNPPPDGTAVSTLVTLVYGKQPTDLAADSTEPGLPRNYHWVIKEGALLLALRGMRPEDDAGGKYAAMIPLTAQAYDTGKKELIASEANKGRIALTPRG